MRGLWGGEKPNPSCSNEVARHLVRIVQFRLDSSDWTNSSGTHLETKKGSFKGFGLVIGKQGVNHESYQIIWGQDLCSKVLPRMLKGEGIS